MTRKLTCIICPRGCALKVQEEHGVLTVSGNACPKGKQYATDECTHPVRTVTSTVRVNGRPDTMVSVKTAAPVAKDDIFKVMAAIRQATADPPVAIGDTVLADVCGTDIVATANIL